MALLFAKSVPPSRCNKYALAATTHYVGSHLLWYMSHSQDSQTYTPWNCTVLALASSEFTSSNSTKRKTTSSTWRASKLWKAPVMGRCSNDATSSREIVTSPIDKWKLLGSLCHLFAKADISPQLPVSTKHVIRGLNPVAATKPSISGVGLSNFYTFLLWEDNFNSTRTWK